MDNLKRADMKRENGSDTPCIRLKRRKHKKRSSVLKRIVIGGMLVVSVLLVGILIVGHYLRSNLDYEYNPITKDPEQLGVVNPPEEAQEITNIALFGIDSRDDDYAGLSDAIMIVSIDPKLGSIKLVSVVRDTLVKVDGHGYQKINAAYSLGGPELAIKTLNQAFHLNIMEYVTVDFVGLAEIVDAAGGIQVELTKAEISQINGCIDELANKRGLPRDYVSHSGMQTLSGVQAVAFSRIRKVPTINGTRDDYGRTERQRLVMAKLFQKGLEMPFPKSAALIKVLLPYIRTSMGYEDLLSLAKILKNSDIAMESDRIPIDDAIISSGYYVPYIGSCVYYDLEYAADLLNAFFFEDISFKEYADLNGVKKNSWYTGSTGK